MTKRPRPKFTFFVRDEKQWLRETLRGVVREYGPFINIAGANTQRRLRRLELGLSVPQDRAGTKKRLAFAVRRLKVRNLKVTP